VPNQLKKVIENTVYTGVHVSTKTTKLLCEVGLTAKKVPGRKIIVTMAMDLICRESRLVASAI